MGDDDDGAVKAPIPTPNDVFMDQLVAFIARENNLVKLSDDGNKATYGKPSGDDVFVCEADGAFVKVEDSAPPARKRRRLQSAHENTLTNPFDDFSLPDDVL